MSEAYAVYIQGISSLDFIDELDERTRISARNAVNRTLQKVRTALWNYWTPLDVVMLGAGTCLCGNLNGAHTLAAGLTGFCIPSGLSDDESRVYQERLRQVCFTPGHLRHFHLGGHMSWANRNFVAEVVTPRLLNAAACQSSD